MAFPSGTPLARALQEVLGEAGDIKNVCALRKAELASASRSADFIIDIQKRLHATDARLATLAQTPGLAQYAKDQFDNQGLDIAAEFTALRNAIQAARDHIETAVPKDGDGYMLAHQFTNHVVAPRMFAPASTATLRTLLQAVVDAVA